MICRIQSIIFIFICYFYRSGLHVTCIPDPTKWEYFNNEGYRLVDRYGCPRELTEEEHEKHERAYNKV